MIKQGEIVDIKNRSATVRLYRGEKPTGVTLDAKTKEDFQLSEIVLVKMNGFTFFLCTVFSYILPFITTLLAYLISARFTDNVVIIEVCIFAVLFLTYIFVKLFEKTAMFKKLTFCEAIKKSVD